MSVQITTTALFDQWAAVYDTEVNPLLALESRRLPLLFPAIAGAHILDAGCGTGRWLAHLESLGPASLTGCDPSAAMLAQARARLSHTTHLHRATAADLPAPDASLDLILCSFVLSYIDDLSAFAAECFRALKPGGTLLLSDMHPATAAQRGWTRTFHIGGKAIGIPTHIRSFAQILSTLVAHGLALVDLEKPAFAEPERSLFEQAGKLPEFTALLGVPAIFLLKLHKPHLKAVRILLINTTQATSPTDWSSAPAVIGNHDGYNLGCLDLSGYKLLPGLINAHDHLEFALFPNLGRASAQPDYTSSPEWAREIHQTHAAAIAQHQSIPLATRLAFGALRNLLAGVTTVCHHNPIHPELLTPDFPVRIVREFAWAHSLAFENDLSARFTASSPDHPFILHACEGTDASSGEEFHRLDALGLLTPRTVLVHGLALTLNDINVLNARGSAVILCPTSNHFLFGETLSEESITAIQRAALASDSPLTATGDLLDEIAVLHQLPAELLYHLVITSPAAILHLPRTPTDLIAVREHPHLTPAETLAQLTLAEVELVLLGGQVQLASPTLYNRLPAPIREGLHLLEVITPSGVLLRWVRAPLPALFASAEAILGQGNIRLGNKEVRHLATA